MNLGGGACNHNPPKFFARQRLMKKNKINYKIINIFLYVLICLESIYIGIIYAPLYGLQGYIASLIYASIAIVHIFAPSKRLTSLVLWISVSIAIPRLFITIENRINDRTRESLEAIQIEQDNLVIPIKPDYLDCGKLPSWEGAKIENCQTTNKELQAKYLAKMEAYQSEYKELGESRQSVKRGFNLTLSDYGSLIMFIVLSGSLPSVIFLLLIYLSEQDEHSKQIYPNRKSIEEELIEKALLMYHNKIPVSDILKEVGISRTTFYKYVNKKT